MKKSVEEQKLDAKMPAGYGPNNPEPLSLRESELPKEKNTHQPTSQYNTTPDVNPTAKLVNRTEP
ncbi:hypothetical protein [Sporomusa termitida]|uniref:Uncharacterized protein n=1 Tax=Sporomusa termitida TaxID=2377 RepID=A0A517E074_9FIRM|nr:hypothetical protein [Sporomusa termitida]QDR83013.1 hypothetical protein SPTER_44670 [Sporomusa termitida]